MDPNMEGTLSVETFLEVLAKLFTIELSDADWTKFAAKHSGGIVTRSGLVNYKKFLNAVLDPKLDHGFYTPRAAGRVGGIINPRSRKQLRTPQVQLGGGLDAAVSGVVQSARN
jgi:hypothetical protein